MSFSSGGKKTDCPGGELVVLGLGSNRAYKGRESPGLLLAAAGELGDFLSGLKISPFYETLPMHREDQPNFINAAAAGLYKGQPEKLLEDVQKIEKRWGRERSAETRWGERTLDIDILVFGSRIVKAETALGPLEIPHPRLTERAFALRPLLDLFPFLREPGSGKAYAAYLDLLSGGRGAIARYGEAF